MTTTHMLFPSLSLTASAVTKRKRGGPMVVAIVVTLTLITCVCYELCAVSRARDKQDLSGAR
ncbi:hypothetical protein ACQPYK_43625 [Streptosporangium sp. CA-135522]|uniref:hypothetical protein n=1 Tax=Streptosporangium sp. CA-135522 TaxID=3240072 RepID=UPI003D93280C